MDKEKIVGYSADNIFIDVPPHEILTKKQAIEIVKKLKKDKEVDVYGIVPRHTSDIGDMHVMGFLTNHFKIKESELK